MGSQENSVQLLGPRSKIYVVGRGRKNDKINCVCGLAEETVAQHTKIHGHLDPEWEGTTVT
jgi:hypothetical protein